MRRLPVIDLMGGAVVRGVAGRRETYQPIRSRLAPDASPSSIGRALSALGASDCYVADLDAIAGAEPSWAVYRQLIDCGLQLWIDAGCRDVAAAQPLAAFVHQGEPLWRVIVGLESLASVAGLPQIRQAVGVERLVFSLDLKHGVPIAPPGVWPSLSAEAIACQVIDAGVASLMVLDLATVGGYGGPATLPLCRRLHTQWPAVELISGGGVRNEGDLGQFAAAGCDYVLLASALHDGKVTLSPAT